MARRGLLTNNLQPVFELRGFEAPHQKEALNAFLCILLYPRVYDSPDVRKKEGVLFLPCQWAITHVGSVENEGYAVIRVACSW